MKGGASAPLGGDSHEVGGSTYRVQNQRAAHGRFRENTRSRDVQKLLQEEMLCCAKCVCVPETYVWKPDRQRDVIWTWPLGSD